MSAINPRASGLWSTTRSSMSYVSLADSYDEDGEDVDIEGLGFEASDDLDGRTPLDRTIDRIGMGAWTCTSCSPLSPIDPFHSRELPMDALMSLWIR